MSDLVKRLRKRPWIVYPDIREAADELERLQAKEQAHYNERCAMQAKINDAEARVAELEAEIDAERSKRDDPEANFRRALMDAHRNGKEEDLFSILLSLGLIAAFFVMLFSYI